MRAAEKGQTANTKLMLVHGADCNIRNKNGETALDIARKFRKPDVIALLEEERGRLLAAQQNIKPAQREPAQTVLLVEEVQGAESILVIEQPGNATVEAGELSLGLESVEAQNLPNDGPDVEQAVTEGDQAAEPTQQSAQPVMDLALSDLDLDLTE
eukprot:m.146803 g.146803  ORF g.146803 m.146803 type:complete len:156 (-) comp52716_c1_seq31:139-606(-)